MVDFLLNNPQVLIFLVVFILYKVFGRKKQSGVRGAVEEKPKRVNTPEARLRAALEEANRRRSAEGTLPAPAAIQTPAPAVDAASDPFAFHSLMEKGAIAESPRPAVDYDQTAIDYDADSSTFAFRPASEEPDEQEFHLSGFQQFRPAGGISSDPVKVSAVGDDIDQRAPSSIIPVLLSGPDAIRRGIILQEIFGKPKALRR